MWLAFRMSGFGGLAVPEPVTGRWGRFLEIPRDGGFALALEGRDGTLHDTREACAAECDRLNTGNPFAGGNS